VIDLSKYRIIDISREILPGERKIDGEYLHGEVVGGRPVEVQEFMAWSARMHFIQGQTHCATHVEATYKYDENGPELAGMPVESYMGEAVVCNFSGKAAGSAITPDDFAAAGVRCGDIVLAYADPAHAPYLSEAAIDWLIATKIKAFAAQDIEFGPDGYPGGGQASPDGKLLMAGIPLVDDVVGLSQITKPRVFFIGLPLKMKRVTASWARAIVLEEIG